MSLDRLRGLVVRLRRAFGGHRAEEELDAELGLHLELETEAGVARGLDPAEARRQALVKFGGVERYREATRDARGLSWLDELRRNVRYAGRTLRRSPGFTGVAVATLALGIGANTAIFSAVDAVLLQPLPFADPDRLVLVWETDRSSGTTREPGSYPDFLDFRERSASLAALAAFRGTDVTRLPEDGEPERISAVQATHDLLPMLPISPLVGRTFTAEEDRPGAPNVALLGESFWRERFDSDPGVVGRTLTINDVPHAIVGVVPDRAAFGVDQVNAAAAYGFGTGAGRVAVWLPLRASVDLYPRQTHPFFLMGRLAAGVTLSSAQEELGRIAGELEATYPENAARGVNLEPFSEVVLGPVRPALLLLMGAVGLVLLVACVNVANLLLARGAARAREVAVRAALGAGGGRIAAQFLVEGLLLTLLGAATGVALAWVGLELLVALAPADIPRLDEVGLDLRVLAFTGVVSAVIAVAFGMVPTLQSRRLDLQATLKAEAGRSSPGRARRGLGGGLVVVEMALAVALVVGAGLLLQSFGRLMRVDPGFRAERVLKAQYELPPSRYPRDFSRFPRWPEVNSLHAELIRRVEGLPGVTAAAVAGSHPLDVGFTNSFLIEGREGEAAEQPEIRTRQVSSGYFATLGVPVVSGRAFTPAEDADATAVVVVNEAAAERFFPGESPIGHRLTFWGITRSIVGVVGNERFAGLDEATPPAVYAPLPQSPASRASLLVRTSGDPLALAGVVRGALRELDPALALYGVEPLERTLSETVSERRFTTLLLALFGGAALLLALIGVHGVLSFTVAQRAGEVGIRMALGASRGAVMRMVVGEGLALAAGGVFLGVAVALAGSRLLASLLYGVSTTDPATFIGVAVATLAVAAAAAWLPARRATQADPIAALRAE